MPLRHPSLDHGSQNLSSFAFLWNYSISDLGATFLSQNYRKSYWIQSFPVFFSLIRQIICKELGKTSLLCASSLFWIQQSSWSHHVGKWESTNHIFRKGPRKIPIFLLQKWVKRKKIKQLRWWQRRKSVCLEGRKWCEFKWKITILRRCWQNSQISLCVNGVQFS